MRRLRDFGRDRRGATAIEYGLICALIFLGMFAGVSRFGAGLSSMLVNVATAAGNRM